MHAGAPPPHVRARRLLLLSIAIALGISAALALQTRRTAEAGSSHAGFRCGPPFKERP
jgi:hypothetical protein